MPRQDEEYLYAVSTERQLFELKERHEKLHAHAAALQARLSLVEALVSRWKELARVVPFPFGYTDCADELQAALNAGGEADHSPTEQAGRNKKG